MANSISTVKQVSECFIKPKFEANNYEKIHNQPYYLAPGDLAMLSAHYIQKGLLFTKPSSNFTITTFLENLKTSLSLTLIHFYPLAGQLSTEIIRVDQQHVGSLIFVDRNKGPGAKFIYATLDMMIMDLVSPLKDVPPIVKSLFDHVNGAVNHDGHTRPLLSVQVTELLDGIFIGCSMNHVVGDGTSFWHLWRTWSHVHRGGIQRSDDLHIHISDPPIHDRWFPKGCNSPKITLPYTHPDEFISRYEYPGQLREKIFHFSSKAISMLKTKANMEAIAKETDTNNKTNISSLQSVSALLWRAITRARILAGECDHNQKITSCTLAANTRQRLNPPLPQGYFGNFVWIAKASVTASELLDQSLGCAALLLHKAVSELNDKAIRSVFEAWMKSPYVYQNEMLLDQNSVHIGSSPRFDVYGNDFGLGKPVAVRSGSGNKLPGKVTGYPGYAGEGSMDFEICLLPDTMSALESDSEFMAFVGAT